MDLIEITQTPPETVLVQVIQPEPLVIEVQTGQQGAQGPKGDQGDVGPANVLSIGTVETGSPAAAVITGTAPSQTLSLVIPQGEIGPVGPPNALSIGTVATGAAGSSASASITGTPPSQSLSLTIPRGDQGVQGVKGDTGDVGPANSLSIGAVTTGNTGDPAAASITGAAPNQTLSLTLPRGEQGEKGDRGDDAFVVSDTEPVNEIGVWIEPGDTLDAIVYESTLAPSLASTLIEGPNVTLSYDSTAQTITIGSTGGGGGTGEVADGSITDIKIAANAAIAPSKIAGTAITSSDSRLSDSRTPTPHKSTHAVGGTDVLSPADIGLGNVNNTSDASKPISTATQTALDLKAPLASPTFTGTVSGITKSMVGLANVDNTTDLAKPVSTATQTALNLKAPLASPTFTGTVSGITKAMVGLGNVDNTTDLAKPVSTATQTALNLKAPLASPAFTGTPTGITKAHVGLGNVDNTSDASKPVSTATQTALNLKLNTSDLNESVQDMLNTFLVPGTNISLSYNDTSNTLTISSTVPNGVDGKSAYQLALDSGLDPSITEEEWLGSLQGQSGVDGEMVGAPLIILGPSDPDPVVTEPTVIIRTET